MKLQFKHLTILLIIVIGLGIRLLPLLRTSSLIGADGYFHLVLIKEIINNKNIDFWHPFSAGGKYTSYPPGLHTLAVASSLLTQMKPDLITMIIPLILFIVIVLFVYKKAGLLAAAALTFTPVFIWKSTINFLPDPLWVLLLIIGFEKTKVGLLSLLALACTHTMSLIAIPFAWLFRKKGSKLFYIAAIILAVSWFVGSSREVPEALQKYFFEGFPIDAFIQRTGLPILGLIGSPWTIVWFLIMFGLAFLKILELDRSIMGSVVFMSINLPKNKWLWILVIGQIILGLYMLEAINWAFPDYLLPSLIWLKENSISTVAAPYHIGYWVEGIAQKPNVLDGNWEDVNSEKRFADHFVILNGPENEARELMKEYNSTFILNLEQKRWYNVVFQDNNSTISR
jgi:hypothetical protein